MTSGTPFALVDAFVTDRAFSGNPAGVVLLDDLSDVAWMQGVANELAQPHRHNQDGGRRGLALLRPDLRHPGGPGHRLRPLHRRAVLARRLGPVLLAEQASPRGGALTVMTTDNDRVRLGGRARTSASGLLLR